VKEELVNELTGEVRAAPDYIAHLRTLERAIVRLDDTIASQKANLKQAKYARDAAVSDLRAVIREHNVVAPGRRGKKRR